MTIHKLGSKSLYRPWESLGSRKEAEIDERDHAMDFAAADAGAPFLEELAVAPATKLASTEPAYDEREASEVLGISRWRLKRLRRIGEGPPWRDSGGFVWYPVEALLAWQVQPAPPPSAE